MMPELRIAMWSGPRNLSTAMMYSFAQRHDTNVLDEPLYAAYLKDTGLSHPMTDKVIMSGETDAELVISLLSENPCRKPIQYQKHITKHLLPDYPRDWLAKVTNVFLIRHPARVICSYHAKDENPLMSDIGIRDQWHIYERVVELGQKPLVIDSADVLANPRASLQNLCDGLHIDFDERMLHWPKGPKPYDGVWASHWYQSVWQSDGFGKPPGDLPAVPLDLQPLLEEAMPYYEKLKALT